MYKVTKSAEVYMYLHVLYNFVGVELLSWLMLVLSFRFSPSSVLYMHAASFFERGEGANLSEIPNNAPF